MSKKKDICHVEGCTRDAIGPCGYCPPCYSRTRYWDKKSIRQRIGRLNQIKVWENSLAAQTGNVKTLGAKSRRTARG